MQIENRKLEDGADTNPKSKIETPKSPTPPRRRGLALLGAAAGAAALVAGIVITIKNEKGETIAQFESDKPVVFDKLAPGTKLIVENKADGKRQKAEEEGTGNSTQGTDNPKSNPGAPGQNPKSWHGWPADAPAPAIAPFDAAQAKTHQQEWADYLKLPVDYTNTIGMKFALIPPGEFTMGSTAEEIERALFEVGGSQFWQDCIRSEAPRHKVVLTRPFYVSVHEVTQKEYEAVIGKNPSHFAKTGPEEQPRQRVADLDTAHFPVDGVSWNDTAEYCAKLSKQEKLKPFYFRADGAVTDLKGNGYRLPTEAEWEFACRAGTTTIFWTGDKSPSGWFKGNSGARTHEVEELASNPFGLFDVHGNVWEWVEDGWQPAFYQQFAKMPAIDPKSPFTPGTPRVFRGGDWDSYASDCRSARRSNDPTYLFHHIGFRVALAVDALRHESLGAGVGLRGAE